MYYANENETTSYESKEVVRKPQGEATDKGYNIVDFIKTSENPGSSWISSVQQISVELKELYYEKDVSNSEQALADFVLAFVQLNFEYRLDIDLYSSPEYIAFPAETISNRGGDCENMSVLYSSIMYFLGYDAGIIIYNDHVISAVCLNSFQETEHSDDLFLNHIYVRCGNETHVAYGCETTPRPQQPFGYVGTEFESKTGTVYMKYH